MTALSVRLRRLRRTDAAAVLAAFASNPDMARQGDVSTLPEAEQYVERLIADESAHEAWGLVDDDSVVGLVCVSVDEVNRSGWFWYWMTDAARGRGWMARAAATVAEWALTVRGLERLELGHRVNNPASGSIAKRAGFVKEGTEREKFLVDGNRVDVDTYARLRTDPSPSFEGILMSDDERPVAPAPISDPARRNPAKSRPAGTDRPASAAVTEFQPTEAWYADWPYDVETRVRVQASVTGTAAPRAVQEFLKPLQRSLDAEVPDGVTRYSWGGFTAEVAPSLGGGAWLIVLMSAGEDGFDAAQGAADDLAAAARETPGDVSLTWIELPATTAT